MVKKVGDYEWRQLSMWDMAPAKSVQTFVKSSDGMHVFHYYLRKVIELVSDSHSRSEVVESTDGVPEEILNWRDGEIKGNGIK